MLATKLPVLTRKACIHVKKRNFWGEAYPGEIWERNLGSIFRRLRLVGLVSVVSRSGWFFLDDLFQAFYTLLQLFELLLSVSNDMV